MSRKRALTEQQAIDAEAWFSEYERIGTVDAKCRELGVSEDTLRDAVRRVRGELTKPIRRKISEAESSRMLEIPCKPCRLCGAEHSRRHSSGRSKRLCQSCSAKRAKELRPKYSQMTDEERFKANARSYANSYQRRGALKPEPCVDCSNPDAEKHHHDYTKPLDVVWLCRTCHMRRHDEQRDDVPHETLESA
jgi:hypothetical protein